MEKLFEIKYETLKYEGTFRFECTSWLFSFINVFFWISIFSLLEQSLHIGAAFFWIFLQALTCKSNSSDGCGSSVEDVLLWEDNNSQPFKFVWMMLNSSRDHIYHLPERSTLTLMNGSFRIMFKYISLMWSITVLRAWRKWCPWILLESLIIQIKARFSNRS